MRVTILVDNSEGPPPLVSEHGLSLWIEDGQTRILFDTGQGSVLGRNATTLGVSLARAEAVVLSHGHYDHTGGLPEALRGRSGVPVFAHPVVTSTRYSRSRGTVREVGMPEEARGALARSGRLVPTLAPTTVSGRVRVTGPIPRGHSSDRAASVFHTDPLGREVDSFVDDQALFVETGKGVVLLLGCAHAGVVETVQYVERLTSASVRFVLGGMHLGSATDETIRETVQFLARRDIGQLVPCHCTGALATRALEDAFGSRCLPGFSGASYEIEG